MALTNNSMPLVEMVARGGSARMQKSWLQASWLVVTWHLDMVLNLVRARLRSAADNRVIDQGATQIARSDKWKASFMSEHGDFL
jgi:hypothetical protein